jgi:DNA-binding response OmpR family regulator
MKGVKLLIVDDEPIRFVLGRAFKLLGYDVTEVANGEEALSCLEKEIYDLMVLDMELPGLKGMEIISLVSGKWPNLAIIVLTGHASVDNAVTALKLETVVDYLQKSATLEEIVDSVANALHKREMHLGKENLARMVQEYPNLLSETGSVSKDYIPPEKKQPQTLLIRPLLLNRLERSVTFVDNPDQVVTLSKGETAVLYSLMSHPDKVLSCQQLVQMIWGYQADKDHSQSIIRPYISRLRKKLGAVSAKSAFIRTIRKRGYMLVSKNN